MIERVWDWPSFIFYIALACFICNSVRIYLNDCKDSLWIRHSIFIIRKSELTYFTLFLVLTCVASFRQVEELIGGTDAIVYVESFYNANMVFFDADNWFSLQQQEPLMYIMQNIIRLFTGNYHIYFFIIYGFMVFCYLYFIAKLKDANINSAPYMLLIIYYLHTFNTIRSSLAVAFVILAFIRLSQGKKKGYIALVIIASLIHYTALICLIFYAYSLFANRNLFKNIQSQLLILLIGYGIIFVLDVFFVGLLNSTKYAVYLDQSNSLIGQAPIILLCILTIFYYDELRDKLKGKEIFINCVFFETLIIPFVTNYGFFRAHDYFALPLLFVWGNILKIVENKVPHKNKLLFNVCIFCIMLSWISFRLYKDWLPESIMPYIPFFLVNL